MKKITFLVVFMSLWFLSYTQTLIDTTIVGSRIFYFYSYDDYKPDSAFFKSCKDTLFKVPTGLTKNGWQLERNIKDSLHYHIYPSLQFLQTKHIAEIEIRCATNKEGVEILVLRFGFLVKERLAKLTREEATKVIYTLIKNTTQQYTIKSD